MTTELDAKISRLLELRQSVIDDCTEFNDCDAESWFLSECTNSLPGVLDALTEALWLIESASKIICTGYDGVYSDCYDPLEGEWRERASSLLGKSVIDTDCP